VANISIANLERNWGRL